MISTSRASYFNWKSGKAISQRARSAMLVLLEGTDKDTKASCFLPKCPAKMPVDRFLQVILEGWSYLDVRQRAEVAGLAESMASPKKKQVGSASGSAEKMA